MKAKIYLMTALCIFLIVSMPIAFAALGNPGSGVQQDQSGFSSLSSSLQSQQVLSQPASMQTDPLLGGNLGGYVYNQPLQDTIMRSTGGYSYGPEQFLGESIIMQVQDYEPKQVRQSLLEQQDVPVFIYLRGITAGNILSFLSGEQSATDPLSGIAEIPPIDYITVLPNMTSGSSKYIRFANYIPPRRDLFSLNNLGYLIVYLKRLDNENQTPPDNIINLDLNAKIYLRLQDSNLFGISEQDLSLKQFDNEQAFFDKKNEYSFFTGKGYIRATRITPDSVTLEVYNKNLFPISLYTATPSPSTTGVTANRIITLRKGETSAPLSFMYTGNPLTDLFRITLNDISVPGDKAEIRFKVNGKDIIRNVPVNSRLYPNSNWILTSVSVTQGDPITQNNIESVTQEFRLTPQQKSNIAAFIANGANPIVMSHIIRIENQITHETRTVTRKIITAGDGSALHFTYTPIAADRANFLEDNKYCGGTNPSKVDKNDVACKAILEYKNLIKNYPDSEQAKAAKKDLKEIYRDQLIEFTPCTRELAGNAAGTDVQDCREYEADMEQLALYYADQIGEKEDITARFGGSGGNDYLDDDGVSLNLNRVITSGEDKSSISLRIYEDNSNSQFTEKIFKQGEVISIPGLNNVSYKDTTGIYVWKIDTVNPTSVTFKLYQDLGKGKYKLTGETPKTLKLNELSSLVTNFPPFKDNQPIRPEIFKQVLVNNIQSNYEAYVTVTPGSGRAFTTSSFQIHIPVDPRPFKWTPDELQSQINSTRNLIKDLDSVINKLDEYISLLKKICLGVFALLTIKNSFTGVTNIARKDVAQFFKTTCQKEMNVGIFKTMESCLNSHSDEIKSSTSKVSGYMDSINSKIQGKTADDLLNEGIASPEEEKICGKYSDYYQASVGQNKQDIIKNYRDCLLYAKIQGDSTLSSTYKTYAGAKSTELGVQQKSALYKNATDLIATSSNKDWNKPENIQKVILQLQSQQSKQTKDLGIVQAVVLNKNDPGEWKGDAFVPSAPGATTLQHVNVRGLSAYDALLIKDKNDAAVNQEVCNTLLQASTWNAGHCTVNAAASSTLNPGSNNDGLLQQKIDQLKKDPFYKSGLQQTFVSDQYYNFIHSNSGAVDAMNNDAGTCTSNGGEWNSLNLFGNKCSPKEYYSTASADNTNGILNTGYTGKLTARYNKDGLVYCYPIGRGEYAIVNDPRYGNDIIKSIKIMNVGSNGIMNCGGGDDVNVPGGDQSALDTINTIKKNNAIQFGMNLKRCTPNLAGTARDGEIVGSLNDGLIQKTAIYCDLQSGQALDTVSQPQCIDVMDPTDCKLMFNFCDPVMCPSSRCTLGGRVPQRNVIQSGLIGSVILCAPNIKEGIAVPVCLTGISAGLKNIRSILDGYASCLEINLKQGKNVGICDYIRSVGICEMVWKEAYNLLQISGGVIDWAAGKLSGIPSGGGEYLKFQSSLNNIGESVNVFTNEYKTTYTAQFLSQSTEEIGSQICRLSVNGKLPSIGKILDQLTEPENPPQFTAFFDETPYAAPGDSAGIPNVPAGTQSMSLYNVFYHIYAGTGTYQGSYSQPQSLFSPATSGTPQPIVYSVYLINEQAGYPPLYVTNTGDFAQLQGKIDSGKYAQQSVQKIGKTGYNQICVDINGYKQCGFGRIGTSFGLSEVRDTITGQTAKMNINSAEQCVPDSQTSKDYSAVKLAEIGATQLAAGSGITGLLIPQGGAGIGTGIVTSNLVENNLFSKGLVRFCSTQAPTADTSRWQKVGTCGKDKNEKSRGDCWLDMTSVKITDTQISNKVKSDLTAQGQANIALIDPNTGQSVLTALNQARNGILEGIRKLVQDNKKLQPKLQSRTVVVPTSTSTSSSSSSSSSVNLIGPSVWCNGNEGLPSQIYQNKIKNIAWNSNGQTLETLSVNLGLNGGVNPALLATHMIYESSMGSNDPCHAAGKSSLTGCQWLPTCKKNCGCTGASTVSDEEQLKCTVNTDNNAYKEATGQIPQSGNYNWCNAYSSDQDKMWKCILCTYSGDDKRKVNSDGDPRYFTKDGTCIYAEEFKQTYCGWVNYFNQNNIVTNNPSSQSTPTGAFSFAIVSDYHDGDNTKTQLVNKLVSLKPDFVVFLGDTINANSGSYQTNWNNFFSNIVTPLKNANIPLFSIVGNHDYENDPVKLNYYNQIWKKFYTDNSGLYNQFGNFYSQSTFPYYYFDYGGKRFLMMQAPDNTIDNAQLSWVDSNILPNSFVFSHVPLVNVGGDTCASGIDADHAINCNFYKNLYIRDPAQTDILNDLTKTNSISFGGHLHYFYETIYKGGQGQYNAKLVFVPSSGKQDNRGILRTADPAIVQLPGFVLVNVGSSVNVNEYLLDGGNFRQFNNVDANKYFPTQTELTQLGEQDIFTQWS